MDFLANFDEVTKLTPLICSAAVITIVKGIRNSIYTINDRTTSKFARRSVMECPKVNAVASKAIRPNLVRSNDAANAIKKRIWSRPERSVM